MVTLNSIGNDTVPTFSFYGLSTDSKPTEYNGKIPNGSIFLEMDTGTLYFFDASQQKWVGD